ncbi:MAG TPA: YggS family pyridoxal phosphate-dependent enzyme [Methylomirabilota bacterium]|nr:YggS family pyridoxal phosphate-dependent enzyme [Methylomirabilota bacterium]
MSLADNLETIEKRIQGACARAGRKREEVQLMGVTKGHPAEAVREALDLGIALFGENKVQEAKWKIPASPAKARWHMIGHLQTNKAKDAVALFSMIQSVDSLRLAIELQKAAEKLSKTLPILLEVNVAGEASKFGYSPRQALADFAEINRLSRLEVHGLMTIAPYSTDPERARGYFKQLRELRGACEQVLGAPLPELSMGMSGDFEVAIEEGATIIRVGTSLFGDRPKRTPAEADAE